VNFFDDESLVGASDQSLVDRFHGKCLAWFYRCVT
jgi:hypothetical protein